MIIEITIEINIIAGEEVDLQIEHVKKQFW